MAQKKTSEDSPELRRKSIEADVAAFLAAGNQIEEVPIGISSQDTQGRGEQLRLSSAKDEKTTENKPSETDGSNDQKEQSAS